MKKILLIEDEHDLLDEVSSLLEYEGFCVFVASSGEQGIMTAKNELPDLILCDIRMPGTDGFEVLAQIKKNKITSFTPFIFITAFNDPAKTKHGIELGADAVLIKPFSRLELLQAINTHLWKVDATTEETYKNTIS